MLQSILKMLKLLSRVKAPSHKTLGERATDHPIWIRRRWRRLQVGSAIGLCTGLFLTGVILAGGLKPFESRFADLFASPRAPSGQVVLIVVDDKTVDAFDWPADRITQGGFLFALIRAEPRVIALDFVLPDPTDPFEDERLAAIIRRASKIVQPVLGIEATRYPSIPGQFHAYDSLLRPASPLRTANTTLAHTMIYPDSDGIVRRVPLAIDSPGLRLPAFGLATLELAQATEPKVEITNNQFVFGDQRVPVDENGQLRINFFNLNSLQKISYVDIVQGKADYSLLRDKIVLVGPITKASHESYSVPFTISDTPLYNVELQANLIETLVSGNFLREEDRFALVVQIMLVAWVAGATLVQLPWLYAAALAVIYLAAYLLYGFQRFNNGIIETPLYASLALILTYTLTTLYRYLTVERRRALVSRIFLGAIAPESVHDLLSLYERGALPLSGGRREVTVLCASLRGLTALSESLAPEAAFELLDKYMAQISDTIFRHGGSIHSHIGNTIFAMWNLPLSHPDHAQRAVRAAFEIRRQILDIDEASGQPQVECGLGVATGAVVAGRLTASPRAEYSIIGDVVNVAERLSILATQNRIFVDNTTHDQAGGEYEAQRAQAIHIRGKKEPVQSWELVPRLNLNQIPLS